MIHYPTAPTYASLAHFQLLGWTKFDFARSFVTHYVIRVHSYNLLSGKLVEAVMPAVMMSNEVVVELTLLKTDGSEVTPIIESNP